MTTAPTTPYRYTIFTGQVGGETVWVLRDNQTQRDYPFVTKQTAVLATEQITAAQDDVFIKLPAHLAFFGTPDESPEVLDVHEVIVATPGAR